MQLFPSLRTVSCFYLILEFMDGGSELKQQVETQKIQVKAAF